jgi:hypothetical protein
MNETDISFAQKIVAEMGLTHEQNTTSYINIRGEEVEGQIIFSDKNDDMLIRYLDPYGNEAVYYDDNGKAKTYIVKRKKVADKSGKYKNPYGADALPFLPPLIITKVKSGIPIETLYITEGAKKAFVASVRGLDCIGISGIFQFKVKGTRELHPYITTVIKECSVKNLVLLFDADARNLTSHDDDLTLEERTRKDMAYRSNGFASAGKTFKEDSLLTFVNTYIGVIKSGHKAKGLDDLYIELPNESEEITQDALLRSHATNYFDVLSLKDNSHGKINEFFGLDSVDSFYKLHQEKLGTNDFNFRNKIYCYNSETEKVEESENNFIQFYTPIRNDEGQIIDVKIDPKLYLELLHEYGFRVFRLSVIDLIYVRIIDNVVSNVSSKDIKEFILAYINNQKLIPPVEKHLVINKLLLFSTLFSREILEVLQTLPNTFHKDTSTQMFFYFKNGFVEVTKNGPRLMPYSELSEFIWDAQIIQKEYAEPVKGSFQDFPFFRFAQNVSSIREGKQWRIDYDRLDAFMSILGYALHTTKKERKAIVFTDTEISDKPEGRTGKTIIGKALGQLRVYAEIDGKNFDPENRFKYQNATIDTQILHINDAGRGKKKFDFELMFTAVTEGVTVEKKNQPIFVIQPAIIISSNRAIEINGGSAKARVIEFEFANYYSDTFSPKDDFGIWFFDDWNHQDWNLFYYFLFTCCRSYLANGVVKPESVNLDKRKLIQATGNSEDFLQFAEEKIKIGDELSKRQLLQDFKQENPEYEKLTSQAFTSWLKAYATYKKVTLVEGKKVDGDRHFIFKGKTDD